jgi:hypothetical protein
MVVFVIINNKHFMDKNVFGTRELAEKYLTEKGYYHFYGNLYRTDEQLAEIREYEVQY